MEIAILIACYNREQITLNSLKALFNQKLSNVKLNVFLVDDGSTDGTSESVKKLYPFVKIIKGNGNLFWNGSMRLAWEDAINSGNFDFYLWLNDDTILFENALQILIESFETVKNISGKQAIIVGSTNDNEGCFSYGGRIKKNSYDVLASKWLFPTEKIQPIKTFNGNIVLVPHSAYLKLGNLDRKFIHAMGDIDYGLRASDKNISIYLAPGYIGNCSRNVIQPAWTNPEISFKERLKNLNSPKGLPLKQWKYFVKQHTGIFWPFYYFKIIIRVLFPWIW